jgi:hypothetical protein
MSTTDLMEEEGAELRRYAKCIEVSRRLRWDIETDVMRGRAFDLADKFLPDGLSLVQRIEGLSAGERQRLSQVQGRTYAAMFGLVERFIGAKMLELAHGHALGDQVALEALVRFTDEELKHQALFRRLDTLLDEVMPPGHACVADPNEIAQFVLGKSTWAVLALTCHIELFTQAHYRHSMDDDSGLSPLFKDVFLFHWREESQHAILDELEWAREDRRLTPDEREQAIDELIALALGFDQVLQQQAEADASYFAALCGRPLSPHELQQVQRGLRQAYRWQFLVSGFEEPRFVQLLGDKLAAGQLKRLQQALAPLYDDA